MRKIVQVIAASAVGLSLALVVAGCGPSPTTGEMPKDKMAKDKMGADKMDGKDKMATDKMDAKDKMSTDKMDAKDKK
jgi:hypothetical protein